MQKNYHESYAQSFEAFLAHTDEKQVFIEEFESYIDRYHADSILDIGAGNGSLALAIAPRVAQYTAVEYNPKYAQRLREAGLSVLEATYPTPIDGEFDLVIMSHVISYAMRNHMPLITNAWERVGNGGHLVIVTHRGERDDWRDLLERIGMGQVDTYEPIYHEIIDALKSRGETEVHRVVTALETDNVTDMINAMAFVASGGKPEVLDVFMAASPKIQALLDEKYRVSNGYTFPFTHIFISTQK